MPAPSETNERVDLDQKSYRKEKQPRDLTLRQSGSHGQDGQHETREDQFDRLETETNQRDLRIKITLRLLKSCHGQLARPNHWKAEMDELMEQKIRGRAS